MKPDTGSLRDNDDISFLPSLRPISFVVIFSEIKIMQNLRRKMTTRFRKSMYLAGHVEHGDCGLSELETSSAEADRRQRNSSIVDGSRRLTCQPVDNRRLAAPVQTDH